MSGNEEIISTGSRGDFTKKGLGKEVMEKPRDRDDKQK